jgi:hypothetical protein
MVDFKHALWGYELTYPDQWLHQTQIEAENAQVEVFQADPGALEPDYDGPITGQLAVRASWNPALEPVEPLWSRAMGLLASMMGAAKVGSAPWQLRDAAGLEAEIVLPKRENTRLWTGILTRGALVLHFVAVHPKEERKWFEPYATRIISSLRFSAANERLSTTKWDLPLPPGYIEIDPVEVIPDIPDPDDWQAYDGASPANALQAFYFRETIGRGWHVLDYQPFPNPDEEAAGLGFARIQLQNGDRSATIGIMPTGNTQVNAWSPARVVMKFNR